MNRQDKGVHRGPWAGDRFVITPGPEFIAENRNRAHFTDVSDEVVADLQDIFDAENAMDNYVKCRLTDVTQDHRWFVSDNADPSSVGQWGDECIRFRFNRYI